MEYNERQVSERWLAQKFEQKLSDIEAQKVCIAKYKQFLDYAKKIDTENIPNFEQNRLLSAYLFCAVGNKKVHIHDDFSSYTTSSLQFQKNVNDFDYVGLANRLIGTNVEKKVWLDKLFLLDYGCCEDYGWFEYLKMCRPYVKIACSSNFDNSKTYSEQDIIQLVKTKQIFLIDLGFEESEKEINFSYDTKYVNTPIKNTLILTKDIRVGDGTVPLGTRIEYKGRAIAETYESYSNLKTYRFNYSLLTTQGRRYLQNFQKETQNLYPKFLLSLLQHLISSIPSEIKARNAKLEQSKIEAENFIKKNYDNYKKMLEEKILTSEKEENEKLEKLKNLPEVKSNFEF